VSIRLNEQAPGALRRPVEAYEPVEVLRRVEGEHGAACLPADGERLLLDVTLARSAAGTAAVLLDSRSLEHEDVDRRRVADQPFQ
jgi:hypothetical protein